MESKAVAISYNKEEKAPKIVAKGKRKLADRIVEIAREFGIPVEKNDFLAEALFNFDIDDYIPEEFYPIVAEILAFVFRLKGN